jgi:hypothetical protein
VVDASLVQLGRLEVGLADLELPGEPLRVVLARVGVAPDGAPLIVGLPADGWRPLKVTEAVGGPPVFGAHLEDGRWFLGQVRQIGEGLVFDPSGPVERYPSKAQRRAGLRLRWPKAVKGVPVKRLFIDLVNVSSQRWIPAPVDHLHVVARLTSRSDATSTTGWWSFAWVASQDMRAFPLDPGEYSRVPVHVQGADILKHKPGTVLVHPYLVALGLAGAEPLRLNITEEEVAAEEVAQSARHRRPMPRPPSST